jgi:hypothetical protein
MRIVLSFEQKFCFAWRRWKVEIICNPPAVAEIVHKHCHTSDSEKRLADGRVKTRRHIPTCPKDVAAHAQVCSSMCRDIHLKHTLFKFVAVVRVYITTGVRTQKPRHSWINWGIGTIRMLRFSIKTNILKPGTWIKGAHNTALCFTNILKPGTWITGAHNTALATNRQAERAYDSTVAPGLSN